MLFRIDQTTAANRAKTLAMPYYEFALDNGSGREDLGGDFRARLFPLL
jgi:hypothetical protein